jgi:hypothetical protein
MEALIVQLKRRIADTKASALQNAFTRGYLLAMEHALQLVEHEVQYATKEVK